MSAALAPIVAKVAEHLGADGHVATEVAPSADGRFSGRLDGASVVGAEKLSRLERFADLTYGAWELHAAYGDQMADAPLLAAARHPAAVCPSRALARLAAAKGWTILGW